MTRHRAKNEALARVFGFFDRQVMNNVHRSHYVECLVEALLGKSWRLMHEWAAWDLEHESGARLEVKQAAAQQAWDPPGKVQPRPPRFDIAARQGYWTPDSQWIRQPGRFADVYVFGWHPETRADVVDHRDPTQWRFFVLPTRDLPNQNTIGLAPLKRLVQSTRAESLASTVERLRTRIGRPIKRR